MTTEPLGKPRKTSKWESDERKTFSEGQEQGDKELFPFVGKWLPFDGNTIQKHLKYHT